jgi:hypothetical protein
MSPGRERAQNAVVLPDVGGRADGEKNAHA